jgi:hypothetical protein
MLELLIDALGRQPKSVTVERKPSVKIGYGKCQNRGSGFHSMPFYRHLHRREALIILGRCLAAKEPASCEAGPTDPRPTSFRLVKCRQSMWYGHGSNSPQDPNDYRPILRNFECPLQNRRAEVPAARDRQVRAE